MRRARRQRHVEWVHAIRWPTQVKRHPTWPGVAALTLAVGANLVAHAVARSAVNASSGPVMMGTSVAVLAALVGAAAGADLLLLAVSSRRLFLYSSMLWLSWAFLVAATVFFVPVPLFGSFHELTTTGRFTAREVAGVGAVAASLACVGFASVAGHKAWRSMVAERTWWHH